MTETWKLCAQMKSKIIWYLPFLVPKFSYKLSQFSLLLSSTLRHLSTMLQCWLGASVTDTKVIIHKIWPIIWILKLHSFLSCHIFTWNFQWMLLQYLATFWHLEHVSPYQESSVMWFCMPVCQMCGKGTFSQIQSHMIPFAKYLYTIGLCIAFFKNRLFGIII